MSYKCDQHGELPTEWCAECGKIVRCDCSTVETTRLSDLWFENWATDIYITFCPTCGDKKGVSFDR